MSPSLLSIPSYQATFAVPLHCDSCVSDVSSALNKLKGVELIQASIPSQTVTILSTLPPSLLVSTIQSTGRDAILRGSGASNSAAVSILETPFRRPSPSSSTSSSVVSVQSSSTSDPIADAMASSPVRGLVRMIQLADKLTLLDISLSKVPAGEYAISIRQSGDVSQGRRNLGGIWKRVHESDSEDKQKGGGVEAGDVGSLNIESEGKGQTMVLAHWPVWEVIGRGFMVERLRKEGATDQGAAEEEEEGLALGVIARSAGVWDNDKTVCSCSGKTVWEEREEQRKRGII
ncbi:copper chaperone [Agyrium rufum]|nr:copper chaperone [Agyrium rufum]